MNISMISYGSNYNSEPLNLNEDKALEHSVALQDTAVCESNGGTVKVNSQKHVCMLQVCMHTCTYAHK